MNVVDSEEKLVALGFHQYPKVRGVDDDYVICRYQKRFTDDKGIKYFLDCKVNDWSWCGLSDQKTTFVFETQVYQRGSHEAINIEFFTKDVDEMTGLLDSMFETNLLEHYRLFDE